MRATCRLYKWTVRERKRWGGTVTLCIHKEHAIDSHTAEWLPESYTLSFSRASISRFVSFPRCKIINYVRILFYELAQKATEFPKASPLNLSLVCHNPKTTVSLQYSMVIGHNGGIGRIEAFYSLDLCQSLLREYQRSQCYTWTSDVRTLCNP